MEPLAINYLAVLAAAVSTFVLGGLWYSPVLFGKRWQQELGLTDEQLAATNPAKIFGPSLVFALIMAFNLAAFIGGKASFSFAVFAALAAGLGWVAPAMGTTYLFERRSLRLILIDTGYHMVSFAVMGVILGAWR